MNTQQIQAVQQSFRLLEPVAEPAMLKFYDRLFEIAPEIRSMFPDDLSGQKKKLMAMLGTVVASLIRLDQLLPAVRALGQRHADYGVTAAHFEPVGAALLWTLEQGLGDDFTPEVKDAWTAVYTVLSSLMINAIEQKKMAQAA